jgi:outer membrane protein OmpA-like peptidoglycan-associated protein
MPLLANISVTNTENNEVVFEDISDYLDGQFIATLPIGNNYAVHVQSEGYLFDSEQYDLVDIELANEEFIKEILLDPIKSGSITRLDNVYFDINKYDLLPDSESDLQLLLNFLKLNSSTIVEIGGHTDSTGNQESNKTLSEKRAQAVVSYLMTHGIAAQQISSKGYGDQWPVADNGTEEGRRLNRRTEIKVLR